MYSFSRSRSRSNVNVNVNEDVNDDASNESESESEREINNLNPSDFTRDPDQSNLWQRLRNSCLKSRNLISQYFNDCDGVLYSQSPEITSAVFIQERFYEITTFIDSKIDGILRVAVDEKDEEIATDLTFEYVEQLIEVIEDISWIFSQMPLRCGEHFWKLYVRRLERVFDVVEGIERIWWAIRKGLGGLPRSRDYSTAYLFKNIAVSAGEDAQKKWDVHVEKLREACEAMKSVLKHGNVIVHGNVNVNVNEETEDEEEEDDDFIQSFEGEITVNSILMISSSAEATQTRTRTQEVAPVSFDANELDFIKKCLPIIKLTHTIFKRIRLRCLTSDSCSCFVVNHTDNCNDICKSPSKSLRRIPLDDLLDVASLITPISDEIAAKLIILPQDNQLICERLQRLTNLIGRMVEMVIADIVNREPRGGEWSEDSNVKWFDVEMKNLMKLMLPVSGFNPTR